MIKKTVIWVLSLVLAAVSLSTASADQSIGFQYYFNQGVKAFKAHHDPKALRCFKIAQIYDSKDKELNAYIDILDERGVIMETYPPYPREEEEPLLPLLPLIPTETISLAPPSALPVAQTPSPAIPSTSPVLPSTSSASPSALPVASSLSPAASSAIPVVPSAMPAAPSISPVVIPRPALYVMAQGPKQAPVVIPLAQILSEGLTKPTMHIELNSSVILEGKNIQKFLVVDEGFISVKTLDANRIEVDALRIGSTFLHIWDDLGRHTLLVDVVFPKTVSAEEIQALNTVGHSQPFRFTYTNDWSTYYTGKNVSTLKRQSYDLDQTLGVTGETPYGFLDASGSYIDFDGTSQFDTYTMGLSQIPLEGTSNFNLRAFDALRYLSPLTMPGTRLRGVFADVDLLDDYLGVSLSHGQVEAPLGFYSLGGTEFNDSYVDAAKLTLFPKSETDQYSFNFATAYGSDRPRYLSNHVYSVDGQHKFNDFLTLSAEEAHDNDHDSSLATLKWEDGGLRTGLHFRNIDKDYATISTLPSYQGETGVSWATDADFKNISASSFLETYRDHLNYNPDNPSALNYDANGHVRANLNPNLWTDSDLNYVDNPGELSPLRSFAFNQRISQNFGIWHSLKATVFGGGGYQDSHSSDSNFSDYDREDVIAGIQVPFTDQISTFANYEYDWLSQPADGGNSNPSVINAGLGYQKQFNPKISFTSQLVYRDELGVSGNSSFLSGERSVILSGGVAYNPTENLSIFADCNASKVLFHTDNPSYDDFEVHVGMKVIFGGKTYWDPLGIVSGIVFKDRNGDGKYIIGDEGIPGVKLKVGDKEVTTDKQGRYQVKVRAKWVAVTPVLDSIPGALIFSTRQSVDVMVVQGRKSKADFGLISQTGIYGIVFVDQNGSGVPNAGDKFIGKVKVILDGKTIQKTDYYGSYYFRKVAPGEHVISLDINSLPLNMVPQVKLQNKINVVEGTNYSFNIPVKIDKADSEEE